MSFEARFPQECANNCVDGIKVYELIVGDRQNGYRHAGPCPSDPKPEVVERPACPRCFLVHGINQEECE